MREFLVALNARFTSIIEKGLLSRVNVTGLLRQLQVKIENIYLFKIMKKHGNVFKNWLCPNFLLFPKIGGGGGCTPLVLPACTPMFLIDIKFSVMFRSAFGK